MQNAYNAYAAAARSAQTTASPRELEASLLIKAATRLQSVADDWTIRQTELDGALSYNRKLWTILGTSATEPESPLPESVKQNIGNLTAFILMRTYDIMNDPTPDKLGALVEINRVLAEGLRD